MSTLRSIDLRKVGLVCLGLYAIVLLYRLNDPPGSYAKPGDPPQYVHDECYQAFTAHRYAIGDRNAWNPWGQERGDVARFTTSDLAPYTTYEWIHPPIAKLIMAGFIKIFGFQPTAYRLGSMLSGLGIAVLLWIWTTRMVGPGFGLLCLMLFMSDGMSFVLSRIAMNDIYVTCGIVAACYAMYRFLEMPPLDLPTTSVEPRPDAKKSSPESKKEARKKKEKIDRKRESLKDAWWRTESPGMVRWLFATGVLFGIALATKWNAAPLYAGAIVVTLVRVYLLKQWRMFLYWALAMLAIPPLMYVLSYGYYFSLGYTWDDFTTLHQQIWWYHHNLKATHPFSSEWWEWPWVTQPVWLFMHYDGDGAHRRIMYLMGNPLLWWLFVPSLAWVTVRYVKRQALRDACILFGFFGSWLPWMFIGRVLFIQYLLPAVPFGVMAVATTLEDLAGTFKLKWLPWVWVALCWATFINFYPIWTAQPITPEDLHGSRLLWFHRWHKTNVEGLYW